MDSDAEIMAAFQAGNEAAFDVLVRRWRNRLLAFALRRTDSRDDGLDAVQETFVRVYKHRGRYEENGTFSSWIFRIATNVCHNSIRWHLRHPSVAGWSVGNPAREVQEGEDPSPPPDVAAEAEERAAAVRAAVARLPEPLREVLQLREFEGLCQAEVATRLGCSAKAVEMRVYRARRILKRQLGKMDLIG